MAKADITKKSTEIDKLLTTIDSPRQRRILENYRNHHLLEVGGQGKEVVYGPGMMVEEPEYVLNWAGVVLEVRGRDEVYNRLYRPLIERRANVFVTHREELMVSDNGLAADLLVAAYGTGAVLGLTTGEDLDPAKFYTRTARSLIFFPYDDRGRMVGERATEFPGAEIHEIPEDEFITPEEAAHCLLPLVRPLGDRI